MRELLIKFTRNSEFVMAIGIIGVLVLLMVPLPPFLLDLFLAFSLAGSLGIILTSIYIKKPLEFSVFPSLLLISTLLRLSLNVASTRLILMHGGTKGAGAAGHVIEAFGNFVIGGNYAVGIVIFAILIIINFAVITKGAGRVAEVAARFTLDAMPGKQLAIDADLSAGIINEEGAKKRREDIAREADFYGAMDGSSKFVRGEAIAGLLITAINVIGGLIIGTLQNNMSISQAAQVFTLLTIGDGLVAQIPSIIVSTAAGIVVTRAASGESLGTEMLGQLTRKPIVLVATAFISLTLGFIPGIPAIPFVMISAMMGYLAYREITRQEKVDSDKVESDAREAAKTKTEKPETIIPMEVLELEVGYGLVPHVDPDQKGDLLTRINQIRKQFAQELGIIVPSIQIRDNLDLAPGQYSIVIKGNKVAGSEMLLEHWMAMDPGTVTEVIDGIKTQEPVFGLDAVWILERDKENAIVNGYTVVDISTVISTHLSEVIRKHCHEFVGRQEAQTLLEILRKTHPKVVDDLIPSQISLTVLVKVLQGLLKEQVSIRDLLTIVESLGDNVGLTKDPMILTEFVRSSLARGITKRYVDEKGELAVLTLESSIEERIAQSIVQTDHGVQAAIDPAFLANLIKSLKAQMESISSTSYNQVLLVSPTVRTHVKRLIERFLPNVAVISHQEILGTTSLKTVGEVKLMHAG